MYKTCSRECFWWCLNFRDRGRDSTNASKWYKMLPWSTMLHWWSLLMVGRWREHFVGSRVGEKHIPQTAKDISKICKAYQSITTIYKDIKGYKRIKIYQRNSIYEKHSKAYPSLRMEFIAWDPTLPHEQMQAWSVAAVPISLAWMNDVVTDSSWAARQC